MLLLINYRGESIFSRRYGPQNICVVGSELARITVGEKMGFDPLFGRGV